MKPIIVHLSNDYPDPLNPRKTRAIQNLVEGTPEFRHVVYSLNRMTAWAGIASLPFGPDRVAVSYGALPKGLFWRARLHAVAAWIIADLSAKGLRPDVIEAHKFTIEGVIGLALADHFHVPLVVDIQGKTDTRILKAKRDFRDLYRAIAKRAAQVFPFAPWAVKPFIDTVGLSLDKCSVLPVISGINTLTPATAINAPRLITVFDMERWVDKNLPGLVRAIETLRADIPNIQLDVYGPSTPEEIMKLQKFLNSSPAHDHIHLMGPIPNAELPARVKDYAAFVMPTLIETYGLVHVESLFSGVPVLFSAGRGIDGFFKAEDIGYACDPHNIDDIAHGLRHLIKHEADLKRRIAHLQGEGAFDLLRAPAIIETYRNGLQKALASS